MRVLLVSAGLNDLMRGASVTDMVASFIQMKEAIERQDVYHSNTPNEMVIATILNPPKLVWFEGNGQTPANFENKLDTLKEVNSWIQFYNKENGRTCTPSSAMGELPASSPISSASGVRVSQLMTWSTCLTSGG